MSSTCCHTTVIVENTPSSNINVIVNDAVHPFHIINSYIRTLSSNLMKYENVSSNIISNSSAYLNLEEVAEVNFIQTLTGNFLETYNEMNLMQPLTADWENVTNYIQSGIIDAGFI